MPCRQSEPDNLASHLSSATSDADGSHGLLRAASLQDIVQVAQGTRGLG